MLKPEPVCVQSLKKFACNITTHTTTALPLLFRIGIKVYEMNIHDPSWIHVCVFFGSEKLSILKCSNEGHFMLYYKKNILLFCSISSTKILNSNTVLCIELEYIFNFLLPKHLQTWIQLGSCVFNSYTFIPIGNSSVTLSSLQNVNLAKTFLFFRRI